MNKNEMHADIVAELRSLVKCVEHSIHPRDDLPTVFGKPIMVYFADLADRIEEAYKREMSKIVSKNGADFGQLGDAAAMREALEFIKLASDDYELYCNTKARALDLIYEKACAALSKPPRNCDVGTAEEQAERFDAFCDAHKYVGDDGANWCSTTCPCYNVIDCGVKWAQLPYESEVEK